MFAAAYRAGSDGLVVGPRAERARGARLAPPRRRRRLPARRTRRGCSSCPTCRCWPASPSSWSPQADGPRRICHFIIVVIASDIGGYVLGVLFGKHPMAPPISPKKSWEGFGGSVALLLRRRRPWRLPVLLDGAVVAGRAARAGGGVHGRRSATCASRWSSATSASRTWAPAARPRRPHGPAGLAAALGPGGVAAARRVRLDDATHAGAGRAVFAAPRRAKPPRAPRRPHARRAARGVVEAGGEAVPRRRRCRGTTSSQLADDPQHVDRRPAASRERACRGADAPAADARAAHHLRRGADPQDGVAALRRHARRVGAHALPRTASRCASPRRPAAA